MNRQRRQGGCSLYSPGAGRDWLLISVGPVPLSLSMLTPMIPRKKSTITPLAIHMMRMFCFSSLSWSVIDSSFSDDTTEL
jgi:hypothetical protein